MKLFHCLLRSTFQTNFQMTFKLRGTDATMNGLSKKGSMKERFKILALLGIAIKTRLQCMALPLSYGRAPVLVAERAPQPMCASSTRNLLQDLTTRPPPRKSTSESLTLKSPVFECDGFPLTQTVYTTVPSVFARCRHVADPFTLQEHRCPICIATIRGKSVDESVLDCLGNNLFAACFATA